MLILLSNTLEPLKRSSENLLVIIFGPELQTFSSTNQWVPIWFQRFLLIWRRDYSWTVDTPGGYTFHSYWRSAATAVPDAGATSKRMRYFLVQRWQLSTFQLPRQLLSMLPTSLQHLKRPRSVAEVAVVDKEITTVELNRGDEIGELWDEWPGDVVVNQTDRGCYPII